MQRPPFLRLAILVLCRSTRCTYGCVVAWLRRTVLPTAVDLPWKENVKPRWHRIALLVRETVPKDESLSLVLCAHVLTLPR